MIINVVDNQIDTYIPFVISSDLIIQPYKSDSTLTINMKRTAGMYILIVFTIQALMTKSGI